METVSIEPISKKNLRPILLMKVLESEVDFVAPNSFSLSEAYVDKELCPRAITHNGDIVGFIMYGRYDDEVEYWITRRMIPPELRGRGFAKKAIRLAIADLFEKPDCSEIFISFEPENQVAKKLYESLGFKETGEVIEGELVLKLQKDTQ